MLRVSVVSRVLAGWFMAPVERTAYPRFRRFMSVRELHVFYTPTSLCCSVPVNRGVHFGPPSGVLGQASLGRCLSGAAGGGVPRTAPGCARAAGSRRDLIRLATVVAARTTAMTASDTAVVISGTRGSSP